MRTNDDLYRQMGIAALLPGLQRAVEVLQQQLDEYRTLLASAQAEALPPVKRAYHRKTEAEPAPATNRVYGKTVTPQGIAKMASGIKNYWASMTPEERSAEMKRRQAKGQGRHPKKALHPRDVGHPGHAEWLAKMTERTQKFWASLTPQQRKQRQKKMRAGRIAAKQLVNGKEQQASA